MKLLKKFINAKNVIVFSLLIFNSVIFAHAIVNAGSVATQTGYPTSPATNNLFRIESVETNQALAGCPVSTFNGILGDIVEAGNKMFSNGWRDESCIRAREQAAGSTTTPAPGGTTTPTSLNTTNNNVSVLDALNIVNNKILDQRPASGQDFIQQKVFALTNPGKVYAQEPQNYFPGLGYDLLKPIYGFWGWSVNIVYGIMILIIIGIALAIIFRQNLGGAQTVTIQEAIPKIALAMILIPLSYAISGLFIDFITVGTNAVHDFLIGPNAPGSFVYTNRNPKLTDCAPGGVVDDPCDRGLYADDYRVDWFRAREQIDLKGQATQLAQNFSDGSGLSGFGLFNAISGLLNGIFGTSSGGWTSVAWFGSLINLAISLLTIWIGVKIFIKLFMKYLLLITSPMFAPFVFATAAIPGRGTKAIEDYAKSLGSASLFYIVTYAMFLLTFVFTSPEFQAQIPDIRTGGYVPPLLSLQYILNGAGTSLSNASSTSLTNLLFTLVGLGIYFSIPKMLENIDATLGTDKNPLAQYIKTPIDSFRESWKVTTRTAPALAARTSIAASRGLKNVAYSPFRLRTTLANTADRLRGIDPESDPNSYTNKRRKELAGTMAKLQEDYDATTNPVVRARLKAQMAAIRMRGDRWGTGVGYQGAAAESQPKLDVKFVFGTWTCPDNEIIFNAAQIDAAVSAGGIATYDGDLIFTPVNPLGKLPPRTDINYGWATVGSKVKTRVQEFANYPGDASVAPGTPRGPVQITARDAARGSILNPVGTAAGVTASGATIIPADPANLDVTEIFGRFGAQVGNIGYGSVIIHPVTHVTGMIKESPPDNINLSGTNDYRIRVRIAIDVANFFGPYDNVNKRLTGPTGVMFTETRRVVKTEDRMFRIEDLNMETASGLKLTFRVQL